MSAPFDLPELAKQIPHGAEHLDLARAIYARRALERAVDHGTALLAALGLPPVALDALDAAIATLDALDAAGEDMEPSLAGFQWPHLLIDGEQENEHGTDLDQGEDDRSDDELPLGWAAEGSQDHLVSNTDDGDESAPERHGGGFIPSGHEDAEDDELGEWNEDGEPYLSVVEWNGQGDNWGRSGHATSRWGTDVEDVNEGGGGQYDDPWWTRPAHPGLAGGAHV